MSQRKAAKERPDNAHDAQSRAAASENDAAQEAAAPQEELARLREELEAQRQGRLRALADLENLRKRALVAERQAREEGAASVLQNVISLIDHFDLALDVDPEVATAKSVIDGVRLIRDEFLRMIAEHGATKLDPAPGEAFDPHLHDAIGHEEAPGAAPGTVVRTVQPGYMLGERLIRPAKVLVAPGDEQREEVHIALHSDKAPSAQEEQDGAAAS